MKFAKLLVFLSLMLVSGANDVYYSLYPNCKQENKTLRCQNYLPSDIPRGVTEVIVNELLSDVIYRDMFTGDTWANVESLSISGDEVTLVKSEAFRPLINLARLGLHGERFEIENDSFKGIGELDSLDVSKCMRVTTSLLLNALNGTDKLSRISVLNMSQISILKEGIHLDKEFLTVLQPKNISVLNISHAAITRMNLTTFTDGLCATMEYLDLSFSHLPNIGHFYGTCKSLKRINLDNVVNPLILPLQIRENVIFSLDLELVTAFNILRNTETVAMNRLLRNGIPKVHNVTIVSKRSITINIKKLSLSNNGITYLDLKLINVNNTIEYFDISSNGLTYLHPKILSEASPLKYIDISHNHLNQMAIKNFTEFGTLLKYFAMLETLILKDNKLSHLPQRMFMHNMLVKSIDLSSNYLEEIEFDLSLNKELQVLNLRRNRLFLPSADSIELLQGVILTTTTTVTVDLKENDLLCNQCKCKAFISWVIRNRANVLKDENCMGEHGRKRTIDKSTVSGIDGICKRTMRIVMACIVSIGGSVALGAAIFVIIKHIRGKTRQSKRATMLNKIKAGHYRFGFPTFLAFSGDDEEFVEQFVIQPLSAKLRDIIGTDRDLICIGDRHFKPGHSIAEQTEVCCRKSGVVILVISKSFCASIHCNYEAHIAFEMRKPLILMFREHVAVSDMTPILKVIFRLYTRITWKQQGDEYVMSTTWQNVCEAILDLMMEQPILNKHDCLEVLDDKP